MLKTGEKCPPSVAVSYGGDRFDLGALGKRTVLWFSPKSTIVDETFDKISTRLSP